MDRPPASKREVSLPEGTVQQTVWVTGTAGLIGGYIARVAGTFHRSWKLIALTRRELDLTDFPAVRAAFNGDQPSAIMHCAALSRSPDCQKDPALARKLNIEVTSVLAGLSADTRMLFFSSDLVFDGKRGNYTESDSPAPLSVYAETKVAAENIVLANPKNIVIRTSLNGGSSRTADRGFNEQLRRSWAGGKSVTLFTDEFRSPICAEFTARAAWELLEHGEPGIYHVAGGERLSRWEIGRLVAARWPSLNPKLRAASISEHRGEPRPADTSLNCSKTQKILSFRLPRFSQWLRENPNLEF